MKLLTTISILCCLQSCDLLKPEKKTSKKQVTPERMIEFQKNEDSLLFSWMKRNDVQKEYDTFQMNDFKFELVIAFKVINPNDEDRIVQLPRNIEGLLTQNEVKDVYSENLPPEKEVNSVCSSTVQKVNQQMILANQFLLKPLDETFFKFEENSDVLVKGKNEKWFGVYATGNLIQNYFLRGTVQQNETFMINELIKCNMGVRLKGRGIAFDVILEPVRQPRTLNIYRDQAVFNFSPRLADFKVLDLNHKDRSVLSIDRSFIRLDF